MSKYNQPPLEAHVEALHDEFRLAVDAVLSDGEDELSFPPNSDGHVLVVSKHISEGEGDEGCYSAMFSEKIEGPDDKTLKLKTFYHLYGNGEVAKDVQLEAVRDPALQAEIDQLVAGQRDLLRVLGKAGVSKDEGFAVLSQDTTLPSDNDWVANIASSLIGSQLDTEFDLSGVSYAELQSVVEKIKAIAATEPS